ncbi:MAG: hypothetical protein PHQ28_17420 [Mycobacterium sp.]|nr:hypothetical protein [Mycobacterium sp.]
MIEKACNLWIEPADYRCILTSAAVANGEAVLESRSARAAGEKFAGLAGDLGRMLTARGNHVHLIRPGLCSFPIKQYQWSGPDLQLITRSARELAELVGAAKTLLPRPGCGDGELAWDAVSKAISFLPDTIVAVTET